jgi:hypothetical protein
MAVLYYMQVTTYGLNQKNESFPSYHLQKSAKFRIAFICKETMHCRSNRKNPKIKLFDAQ